MVLNGGTAWENTGGAVSIKSGSGATGGGVLNLTAGEGLWKSSGGQALVSGGPAEEAGGKVMIHGGRGRVGGEAQLVGGLSTNEKGGDVRIRSGFSPIYKSGSVYMASAGTGTRSSAFVSARACFVMVTIGSFD